MIDATAVTYLIAGLFGCWACGFGVGKAVAFTRALRDVA